MITDFIETSEVLTKTTTAKSGKYELNATLVIEEGKVTQIVGDVIDTEVKDTRYRVSFDAVDRGEGLMVNYHNIKPENRGSLSAISEMVDLVVAKYEA